jgi:hypothetical protein
MKREKQMPKLILLGTTVFVLALGIRDANANAGSADLSPDQSPYAILVPETLTNNLPQQPPSFEPQPVYSPAPATRHRRHVREHR